MHIALTSKVQDIVNALVEETIDPVVDPGDGKIYVLDITQREFGTLRYTVFDETTRFPEESFSVKYGTQHVIHQVLYAAFTRKKLDFIIDDEIPGLTRADFDPMIVPALTQVYPTTVPKEKSQSFVKKG